MNKMYILFLIGVFSLIISKKYHSDYYNNVTNILNKYPKVDIDYIFSKPVSKNIEETKGNNSTNNPSSNIFRNIFYDYYQTSVPLYEEKMKCYFPIKKNISLHLDKDYNNFTKTKNISKFFGKNYLKSLKGKCEKYYVERWYYTLCPLIGGMQTLSYIKSQDSQKQQEKQEVNYLGYESDENYYNNNSVFLTNLDSNTKKFVEKKYYNELNDIYEENLYNNNVENSKIIGIYNNFIKLYGNNVFDSSKYPNKDKIFQIEYKTYLSNEPKYLIADIYKIVSDNLILINQTIELNEIIKIKKIEKIKILKKEKKNLYHTFFNQSFFLYDEYVYSSKINLLLCSAKNCFITISNNNEKTYRIETIIDPKFAILESGLKKNMKLTEKDNYLIFYGDEKLYFYGKGDIEELIETEDPDLLILFGENLNIEKSDEIILLYNGTSTEYGNAIFMDTLLGKFIKLKFQSRINATHYHVKMMNKKDKTIFDKQISLDDKYIIVKYNKNKNEYKKKSSEHKYAILGNEKNISLENKNLSYEIKKDSLIITDKSKQKKNNTKSKNNTYLINNNQEFIITFELSVYNDILKESYINLCFSKNKECKQGDYEFLFDLKNNGIVIKQINNETTEPIAFTVNKINNGGNIYKYGIIYMNSTLYLNNYFSDDKNKGESEIILKYKINKEKYDINYMMINKQKSGNIFINDIKIINSVSFDIFKNIYLYNTKYLLDDRTVFIDTFENGDYCDPIKANRKVIIKYICDEEGIYDLKLEKVNEDKKNICVYNYYAKSRLLCNPNTFMKNYAKFSPVKTFCYLDDEK